MGIKNHLGGSTGIPSCVTESMHCTELWWEVWAAQPAREILLCLPWCQQMESFLTAEKDSCLMAGALSRSLGQTDIRKYWSSFSLGSRSPSYLAKDPRNSFCLSR